MAKIKSQGTKIYALIGSAIVRFRCYQSVDLGTDSVGKINTTCLDDEYKTYEQGMVDPGEGSLTVQLDDENTSHAQILTLANAGTNVQWIVGDKSSDDLPTVVNNEVTLPTTRNWVTFDGYLNPIGPTIEADGVWTYAFPLVRTSPSVTILRTVP